MPPRRCRRLSPAASVPARRVFGWTRKNEISNGRWVMMGILIGLMTEYATGERGGRCRRRVENWCCPAGGQLEHQHHTPARCHSPPRCIGNALLTWTPTHPSNPAAPAGVSFIDQLKLMGSYMGLLDLD